MKLNRLGVDMDEIITEYTRGYIDFFNRKYNKNFQFGDIRVYNLWESLGITKEESMQLAEEYNASHFFDNIATVPDSKEALNLLSNKYRLFIVTSRPTSLKEKTSIFLKNNFPRIDFKVMFSSEFMNTNGKTKAEICSRLKIPTFIEDNKDYALQCAKLGINVLLLDKPWNQNSIQNEKIKRVKNWGEILGYLQGQGEQ